MREIIDTYLPGRDVEGESELLELLQTLRGLHATAKNKDSPLPQAVEDKLLGLLWKNPGLRRVETTAALLHVRKLCTNNSDSLCREAGHQELASMDGSQLSNLQNSFATADRAFRRSLQELQKSFKIER